MIHILDRQTEQVLDVLVNHSDSKIYWDTKMTESLDDNQLIFEFTTLADSPTAKFIIPKNKITAQDQDGFHRLFSIETVEKVHDENGKMLIVTALGDHTELGTEQPIAPQTLAGQTPETAVQFVLAGTRYQPGQIDFAGSRTIKFDSYISPLAALNQIASTFGLELRFRVEVHNDGTITRIVDLLETDDVFDGKEIVFGKDMLGIHRKENADNICTRLIGVGPADENGNIVTFASVNDGKIYVEDDNAFQRWNNAGRHVWGIFEYQPESSTEVTPQELLDATKKELQNRINSVVEWDVTAAALEQIPGLQHERVRTGMNIRIKDEAFDPAIYLEARVLETEMPELDDPNGNFSYTFGNYHEVTVVVPAEIKAIQKTLFRNANAWTAAKSLAAQALQDAAKAQATADGKITSFYQPDPPETASEGDLWFDTNDGNKPYIWQNGGWQPAQDNGIAEALNRANDAQATADKKVQTFFSDTAPTAEGVGDLWYNPASGTLFRWDGSGWLVVSDVTGMNTAADTAAVNGRPAGTVLVDIQSAQSTANTAQTAANNAQSAASAAQQAADQAKQAADAAQQTADEAQNEAAQANAMLADISSDSKLTPSEKQATKKEWDAIVSEKPTIDAQADTYGITTEKTNYDNAYSALNSYITPLLANLTTTSNIDGPTFRSKFKAYYDARTALLKKITDLAKEKADAAQSTANTAQTTATNAQNTANTAQQTANTAQTTATNAQNTANAAQSTINANKSIWDRGSFFNSDGTLDVSKLKGLLSDSQIASASRWNGRTTMITDTGVYTGTILANQIIADSLSGISANLGTVNAGTINGVTINSSEFHSSGANGEISIASDTIMSKYENTSGGYTVLNRAELTSGYLIITNIMDDLNATGTFDGLELVIESHEGNKQHLVRLDPDELVFSHGDTSYGGV
ncbi:phage tail spike protein, partial [Caenibacillus caldisaponilyticus]|uniref:phage tail spike protein n=1 Tax=Caenibacillus caldisaponilyticus TaxID=1674942 RepID=UPI001177EED0